MNTITLSLGKNTARLQFGVVDDKHHLSLAAEGPCNKLVLGTLGEPKKQKTARCDDEDVLLTTISAKGFTAYWAVENHDTMEVIRIEVDLKANTVDLALCEGPEDWTDIASANLSVFPNPEYKFYNYRAEVAAKPLNAPKRPRGRPRKPVSE